jgi:hypothetical protein
MNKRKWQGIEMMSDLSITYDMLRVDRRFPHSRMKRAGAKLFYNRYVKRFGSQPFDAHWIMVLHIPCSNGDHGVFATFVRRKRTWKCYGLGRVSKSSNPERSVLIGAGILPDN